MGSVLEFSWFAVVLWIGNWTGNCEELRYAKYVGLSGTIDLGARTGGREGVLLDSGKESWSLLWLPAG
eukprot:IDg2708t1